MFKNTTSKTLSGVLLMLCLSFQVFAQKVTIDIKNAPISTVLSMIQKESGCSVVVKSNDLDLSKVVSISVNKKDVADVVKEVFTSSGQKVDVSVEGNTLSVLIPKTAQPTSSPKNDSKNRTVTGKILEKGSNACIGCQRFSGRYKQWDCNGFGRKLFDFCT